MSSNDVALITGSARRIGAALARALAARGTAVAIHYRSSSEDADTLVREIEGSGGRAASFRADLADPAAMEGLHAAVRDALGAPTILVHNASRFVARSFDETDAEFLREDLAIHVESPFLLSRAFARGLPEGAHGRIVAMLDWRATLPDPEYISYTVAKAGLHGLVRNLAVELGPRVTVNGVAPGAILPPEGGTDAELEELVARLPISRPGTVEEIVEACLFLITGAAYTTGTVIPVDGGRHLL